MTYCHCTDLPSGLLSLPDPEEPGCLLSPSASLGAQCLKIKEYENKLWHGFLVHSGVYILNFFLIEDRNDLYMIIQ